MGDKSYFCFLLEWADMFKLLTAEQSGRLIKAMITYEKDGIEPDFADDTLLNFAWLSNVKNKLDTLQEHYENKKKQTSEAGKASAEKRKRNQRTSTDVKQDKEISTNIESIEQNERTLTDVKVVERNQRTSTDVDNNNKDLDLGLDLDLENKKDLGNNTSSSAEKVAKYQPIIDAWNKLPVPNVRAISGTRLKQLQTRIKQFSFEDIVKAINSIHDSPFLLGQNQRNWQITFDWFIAPNNFPKVLEGNYVNRGDPKITPQVIPKPNGKNDIEYGVALMNSILQGETDGDSG